MIVVSCIWITVRTFLLSRARLAAEILALRQQLAVLKRQKPRPKLKKLDRMFWVVLSKLWAGWRSALMIVQPETILRWHRQGFKLFWRWKSRGGAGRPMIDAEIRRLIRQLSKENPNWGIPHIKAEVWVDGALLDVCDSVSRPQQRTPPGALEDVAFRYTTDETIPWDQAVANNPSHKATLEPVKGWAYAGFGRVEQVMPVVIHFGLLRMEDPNWSTDEELVGKFVRVPIDRLEIVPFQDE